MPEDVLPVDSRRVERIKHLQTIQHLLAALLLAQAAIGHLQSPHNHAVVLPVLELVASAALVVAAIRERVRHARGIEHEPVGWLEIAGSAMGFVEAIRHLYEPHHLSFIVLGFVPPVILLLFGIFDVRIRSRRYLKVDDDGFALRLRLFLPRKRVRWEEMRGFHVQGTGVEFTLRNGSTRKISLRDVKDRDQAIRWLMDQLNRRGIQDSSAAQ
ncbi:MAG TPA: hypothetical protein VNN08_09585 [Thermoanaerobaculia bacterium]|nr:hypothetical protein [Thermoanaerobaculia bacterium]